MSSPRTNSRQILTNVAVFVACLYGLAPVGVRADPAPARSASTATVPTGVGSVVVGRGQGLKATSADGNTWLSLSARIAVRETLQEQADRWRQETHIRTVRLWLRGQAGSPALTWGVQLALGGKEFDADTPTPLFDAFVRWQPHRDLGVQVGQWFVPFDRARTVRESGLALVDRPLVVRELTLDRDVGVALLSDDLAGLGGKLLYRVGLFGGEGRSRFADKGFSLGPMAVARLEWRPFGAFDADVEGVPSGHSPLRLAVGASAARSWAASRSRGTTGSFFASGTTDYQWWNADLHAKWLGGSLLTQWTERERSGGSAPPAQASSGRGLLVQAGWALGKVRNVGVVEVMGRWNRLQSLDRAGATPLAALAGSEWGVGANLYLDGHRLKLQADWQHSTPISGPSAQLARLHLDCTF